MVAHGRVELLAHPLSQKYLQMKWHSYGKYFHLANLLFYCIYLIFVTVYTYLLMMNADPSSPAKKSTKCNQTETMNLDLENKTASNVIFNPGEWHLISIFIMITFSIKINNDLISDFESKVAMYTSTVAILVYNAICLVREAYNVKQQKWHYMVDPSNLVSWLLYVSSSMMVFPTIFGYFNEIQVHNTFRTSRISGPRIGTCETPTLFEWVYILKICYRSNICTIKRNN